MATIRQVLDEVAEVQPNSCGNERLIRWLRQLDMELSEPVMRTHDGWERVKRPAYTIETPDEEELMVREPYDSIYIHWLQARIDWTNGEIGRFNNSNAAFEADRQAFCAWFNRTHMPLQKGVRYF